MFFSEIILIFFFFKIDSTYTGTGTLKTGTWIQIQFIGSLLLHKTTEYIYKITREYFPLFLQNISEKKYHKY